MGGEPIVIMMLVCIKKCSTKNGNSEKCEMYGSESDDKILPSRESMLNQNDDYY